MPKIHYFVAATIYPIDHRALVSMGAVGAIAPTVFESVGASTHGFWLILPQNHHFL